METVTGQQNKLWNLKFLKGSRMNRNVSILQIKQCVLNVFKCTTWERKLQPQIAIIADAFETFQQLWT